MTYYLGDELYYDKPLLLRMSDNNGLQVYNFSTREWRPGHDFVGIFTGDPAVTTISEKEALDVINS